MNVETSIPPVLGFAAHSGAGKTTLLVSLLPIFQQQHIRVGMIKHAHHQFEIDQPGKDSYELRKAGAERTLVASSRRWALIVDNNEESDPVLAELIQRMDPGSLHLVLVEGFKHEVFDKIEVHRAAANKPLLFPDNQTIIAIASDEPLSVPLPVLDLNQPAQVAKFIIDRYL